MRANTLLLTGTVTSRTRRRSDTAHLLEQHGEGAEDVGLHRLLALPEARPQRRSCLDTQVRFICNFSSDQVRCRPTQNLSAYEGAVPLSSMVYGKTSRACGYKSPRSSGYAVRIAASVFAAARRTFQLTSSSSLYWSSLNLADQ